MTVLYNRAGEKRQIHLSDLLDLIEATRKLYKFCRCGQSRGRKALAKTTRVGDTQLARYESQAPGEIDQMMPVDVAMEAGALAGYPYMAEALAAAQGYVIFRPVASGSGSMLELLSKSIRESGALHREIIDSWEDDHEFSEEELIAIRKQALDDQQVDQQIVELADRSLAAIQAQRGQV